MSSYNINCYKYSQKLYDVFIDTFSYLPICTIINKITLCIQGGLRPRFELINRIQKVITSLINSFEEQNLLSDIVWSDPSTNFAFHFYDNPRGKGYLFNSTTVSNFLKYQFF